MITKALFPSGMSILNLASSDVYEMKEQSVFWSFEHNQLSRGKFDGKINAFHTSRIQLSLAHRSVGICVRGGIPEETTIISLPLLLPKLLHYRGQLLKECQVIAINHSEELEFYTSSPTLMLSVAVSSALLEDQARAVNESSFDNLRCQERLNMNPREYCTRTEHLVLLLNRLQYSNFARNGDNEELLEKEILETILLGVLPPGPSSRLPNRLFIAKLAEKYIRNNLKTAISIRDLCNFIGSSERALHIGFKERFGVSPKRYHQIMRLNSVRKDLLLKNDDQTVTGIAIDWGFHHPGRFPEQYSRMFGELPSETRKTLIVRNTEGSI